jgi:DNA invertase Pin-like site-specific DNA recombinase
LRRKIVQLQAGDVVAVTRNDRLARSTFGLFAIVKSISDVGGRFKSLAEPLVDTGTSSGRLMLSVSGGMADIERDFIKARKS